MDGFGLIFFALAVGLVCAIIFAVYICSSYKKKLKAPIYPLEHYATLHLTGREDRFLHRHVSRVRVSSSNNKR